MYIYIYIYICVCVCVCVCVWNNSYDYYILWFKIDHQFYDRRISICLCESKDTIFYIEYVCVYANLSTCVYNMPVYVYMLVCLCVIFVMVDSCFSPTILPCVLKLCNDYLQSIRILWERRSIPNSIHAKETLSFADYAKAFNWLFLVFRIS